MNKTLYIRSLILILAVFMESCWKDTSYRDADYPDQLIYMPAAYNNNQFIIETVNSIRGSLPFDGNPYRYVIDAAKNEFRVPLSVYRSGINNKGAFTVDIKVNTDVIATLNENREVPYTIIPSDKYSVVSTVEMKNGEELAPFDLVIDLNLLRDNAPDAIFALGIEISSKQRERNEKLYVTAVIIHTKILTQ